MLKPTTPIESPLGAPSLGAFQSASPIFAVCWRELGVDREALWPAMFADSRLAPVVPLGQAYRWWGKENPQVTILHLDWLTPGPLVLNYAVALLEAGARAGQVPVTQLAVSVRFPLQRELGTFAVSPAHIMWEDGCHAALGQHGRLEV